MTVPVVEDVQTDTSNNGDDLVITKPTGLAVGDLMVAQISAHGMSSLTPSGWRRLLSTTNTASQTTYVRYATAGDVAASDFTFSFSGATTSDSACGSLYRVSGTDRIVDVDVFDTADTNSNDHICPSVTTRIDDCLVLRAVTVADDVTITVPGSITQDYVLSSTDSNAVASAGGHESQTTAGATGTETFTTPQAEENVRFTIAIPPLPPDPVPIGQSVETDTSINGGDLVIDKPTGLAVGDLMVAQIVAHGSMDPTTPSGWTEEITAANANLRAAVYYKIATAGDVAASNFTFSFSGPELDDTACGSLYRITGHDPTDPINVSGEQNSTNTTNHTSPSVDTTVDDCAIMRFLGVDDNVPITVPVLEDYGLSANDIEPSASAGGRNWLLTAGATGTELFTTPANEDGVNITLAIAPATASNNGPGLRVMGA